MYIQVIKRAGVQYILESVVKELAKDPYKKYIQVIQRSCRQHILKSVVKELAKDPNMKYSTYSTGNLERTGVQS
jgi:hypothetical protein